jgi:hypothetical protein
MCATLLIFQAWICEKTRAIATPILVDFCYCSVKFYELKNVHCHYHYHLIFENSDKKKEKKDGNVRRTILPSHLTSGVIASVSLSLGA